MGSRRHKRQFIYLDSISINTLDYGYYSVHSEFHALDCGLQSVTFVIF
jgi:hypothetical protein